MVEEKNETVTQPEDKTEVSEKDIDEINKEIEKTESNTKEELKQEINSKIQEQVNKKFEDMTTAEKLKSMEEELATSRKQTEEAIIAMKELKETVDNIRPERKGLVGNDGNPMAPPKPLREPTTEDICKLVDNANDKTLAIKKTLGL